MYPRMQTYAYDTHASKPATNKFCVVEWSCDSTVIDIPLCRGNSATVTRPSLPCFVDLITSRRDWSGPRDYIILL